MFRKSIPFLVLASLFSLSGSAQYTDIINSNRPGESFSAFSVGKTIFQIEGGGSYINEKLTTSKATIKGFFADLDIRYGFWKEELEFIAELQYRNDKIEIPNVGNQSRSGLSQTNLGFKYLVYDPYKNYEEKVNIYSWKANQKFKWRQLIPAVAVYAGANFNTNDGKFLYYKDDKNISAKGLIALQNQFNGGWVTVINALADRIGTENMILGGIFTVTKSLDDVWSGFLEGQVYRSDLYKDVILRGGTAFLWNDNVQFDISLGKNFGKARDNFFVGLGASWRFTMNYEDVIRYKSIQNEEYDDGSKNKKDDAPAGGDTPSDGE